MTGAIRFYSVHAAYGELSNFAPCPFVLGGRRWPTSEHYFQAHKFVDRGVQERIRAVPTAMAAAQLGRSRRLKLRPDWERVKLGVMRAAVEAKFRQHPALAALLLDTGDAPLVEHTEHDAFWGDGGDGGDGAGHNHLGRILVAVRAALRERA